MSAAYDAIVVGARCAGSPTAMLLARKGYRVLLVDRASFPSDTLSCRYIHQPGVARLERWDLLPKVARSNCPPVRSMSLDVGPFALKGAPAPSGEVRDAYAVRRTVLDEVLVRAAAAAGAEVRERFSVSEVVTDGDRVVTGIRGRAAGGTTVTESARIVIGADGMNSLIARSVEAPTYDVHPSLTCAYYSYWGAVELEGAELYSRPGQMIIAAPTNDGQVFAIVYWPHREFHRVRCDIEANFMSALQLAPGLAARIRNGTRSERFRGTGTLPNFFRRPHGDGWALVGDAGYHKDPITALGVTDAFRDAELLADAVDAGLSDRQPLGQALADYERRRNEATAELFETTVQFAHLEPPPAAMQPLFEALRNDPHETGRFFGTVTGTVSASEFFAPENIARIIREPVSAGGVKGRRHGLTRSCPPRQLRANQLAPERRSLCRASDALCLGRPRSGSVEDRVTPALRRERAYPRPSRTRSHWTTSERLEAASTHARSGRGAAVRRIVGPLALLGDKQKRAALVRTYPRTAHSQTYAALARPHADALCARQLGFSGRVDSQALG